ncbi:divalent cation transporter [Marivita sp. S6314]|uniref:ZIP family metal transporter n=1 Tax=Marivita sp. S6314 TaxID=2926406 RepID=UPI001FF5643F|nr:divalent cation transporter [Marivita sp. S6314]MCK0150568.1 divalent cation transporter [Marivita sp. S6314]
MLSTLAGISIPAGAFLARFDGVLPGWLREEFRHSVIAFGGGALFSAIALVLVPEGTDRVGALPALILFGAGGLVFGLLDYRLSQGKSRVSQFMAMMLDYIPEAMALGAMLVGQVDVALLLACLIALQNLPEGFNAWREMAGTGHRPRLIWVFLAMVPVGPAAALIGLYVLGDMPEVLGGIMLFSAGGILYLIFEDVAPQVPLQQAWGPPMGAVLGFMLGLAGHLALG